MPYSAGYAIADIASLKALSSADLVNGYSRWVIAKNTWYGWDANSTATSNDDTVVAINAAPSLGRFIKSRGTSTSTSQTREISSYTSPILRSQEKLNFEVSLGKRFDVLSIKTNVAAWVRIYPNAAYRTADANRSINDNPASDYVALVDVVNTSSSLETFIIPNASCASMEATPASSISCTVVNLHATGTQVIVDFVVVVKEP